MFTGIIEEMGTVVSLTHGAKSAKITIKAEKIFSDLKLGDSVAVNGVCLTASDISGDTFTADVMNETFGRTALSLLKNGSYANLERAMSAQGRFGGHIVSGHIDGTGTIRSIEGDGNAIWYEIAADSDIIAHIVLKGSIAIDGISLTVAKLTDETFSVSIIPHTAKETILSEKAVGDKVNLENDIVGKYVERLLSFGRENKKSESKLTAGFLAEHGFL